MCFETELVATGINLSQVLCGGRALTALGGSCGFASPPEAVWKSSCLSRAACQAGAAHLKLRLGSRIVGRRALSEWNSSSETTRGKLQGKERETCSRWAHLVLFECYLSNLCLWVIGWCFLYTGPGQVAVVVLVTWHSLLPFVSVLRGHKSPFPYGSLKKTGYFKGTVKTEAFLDVKRNDVQEITSPLRCRPSSERVCKSLLRLRVPAALRKVWGSVIARCLEGRVFM